MNKANYKYFLLFVIVYLVFLSFNNKGYSQSNPLEKRISINIANESVEKVLNKISQKIEVSFSYNSDIIPLDSIISIIINNETVYNSLNIILGKNYCFKNVGNHIVILKQRYIKQEKSTFTISGIVYNSLTGEKVVNATIYDLNKNFSALTDSTGFYKLTVIPKTENIGLGFSKNEFNDTIIFLKPAKTLTLKIKLNPILKFEKIETKKVNSIPTFNINDYFIVQTFVGSKMLTHAKNLNIQENRTFQFSILPYIGTNRKVSGAITNQISFNAIAGYSKGLSGVELGTILNISKNDIRGFQFAGLGNITGGKTNGLQMAGCFNLNAGKVSGVQMSSFSNFILDTLKGVQIGSVNFAKINKGFQFGIINIVDSSYGVSIGFISIVKKGYYNLSLFTDEMLMGNIEFKMGTQKFYNIWGLSASEKMWGLTYGIGIHKKPEQKLSLNYDLSFTNMSYKKLFEIQVCMKTNLSADLNLRLNKHSDCFAGLSYNIFASDKIIDKELQNYISVITNSNIQISNFKSVKLQFWPGIEIGLKYRM